MKREQCFYRNLKPLDEARAIFFKRFRNTRTDLETAPVREALGRCLAGPVYASRSVPAYDGAAMDGLAVRASCTFSASPDSPVLLRGGLEAKPVNTGEPLPEGTDAVVMIEKAEARGDDFEIREAVNPLQNVRKAGEDIVKGEILLPARQRIRPYDQGALLAAGVLSVEVFRKPRVLIVPTGDEIVRPEDAGARLAPGAIVEVNGQILASLTAECGGESVIMQTVPDDPAAIRKAVTGGLDAGYDLVLLIAGSSAGSKDYVLSVLEEMGELLVHGVMVRPGKPTLLAAVENRPVVGVPGYPVSAAVAFREFVRPLLYRMQGILEPEAETIQAVMGRKLPSKPGVEEQVRVILGKVGERTVAVPLSGGAGVLTSMVRGDGILRIPPGVSGYSEGEAVRVELLTPARALETRLITIGSHDLTIDLLGSLVKEASAGRVTISTSNVGSLGGLIAIDRGIAHFAGCHLLDTETGDYNRFYLRKYVTKTPVVLITLVHRWQGLILQNGNPKSIKDISDLVGPGVFFVNRQPGSGTRILLDYELKKHGIEPARVNGYRNEEYTHMNVAMAVASGRGDAGLGIMAAAKALDLDFIPITRERYDLVFPGAVMEREGVRLLLDIIGSARFREQVLAMGGYEVDETGTRVTL
ncbi:MAG: molybdopterin biosynthesis protein [Bryobacteraceae bacterium]